MDLTPTNLETITSNEQTNYRLLEIGKIRDYFNNEIQYQQSFTSKLGKYLSRQTFDSICNGIFWN